MNAWHLMGRFAATEVHTSVPRTMLDEVTLALSVLLQPGACAVTDLPSVSQQVNP